MLNKHLTKPPSDILLARLKSLFEDVNSAYQSGTMVLESDILNAYHQALNTFYKSLDSSVTSAVNGIYPGAPADPIEFNEFTSAIQKDLKAIFAELGALDRLVSSSFNSIISERNQALETSKRVSNKLGDYLLYSDPKLGAGYFFGDSFNTSNRVDVGSALVGTDECYLSTNEGIVLLPLDGEPERPNIKSFIINAPSNGTKGNNHQINFYGHDQLETIGDNEPDTWFEYEKVTSNESEVPLVLDLTISLEETSVVNHININPINFGTPTPIKVSVIETSKDGIEYLSIKDEIPISDFLSEDEDDVFELSSSAAKSSGQGFYSFLPRKAQYVHIVLEQHTPYSIETVNGLRLRYAIGIRDINILSRRFKTEGTLVSTRFSIDENAKKVSLWASENPVDVSELADITHFLSHDDGATWLPIQPQQRAGNLVPEIVNFNNIASDAVSTENAVDTFRHKIYMLRDPNAFTGDTVIKSERIQKLDVVTSPSGGQASIDLTQTPIKETVRVLMPYMGSFSCPRPRQGPTVVDQSPTMDLDFIKFNVDVDASQTIKTEVSDGEGGTTTEISDKGTVRYKLPFRNIPDLKDKIRVFFNGAQIEYLAKDEDLFSSPPTSHSSIDEYSKVYYLNRDGLELQFGHVDSTGTQRGFIPKAGSRIEICLDGDNPSISLTDRGYVINLMAPSDGDKESISIVALKHLSEDEAETYEIEVPPGATKFIPPQLVSANIKIDSVKEHINNKSFTELHNIGSSKTSSPNKEPDVKFRNKNISSKVSSAKDLKYSTLKERLNAYKELEARLGEDSQEKEFSYGPTGTSFISGQEGSLPPVFLEGIDNFYIKEFDTGTGDVITGVSRQFTDKKPFVDGDSELRDTSGDKVSSRYTFNPQTGTVYLGSEPSAGRRTVLYCKKVDTKVIPQEFWKFDRNVATNRIDSQKIILDPSVVFTVKQITEYSLSENQDVSVQLISGNTSAHSWFNKRIVVGTVKPSLSLFNEGVDPVEVPFIDGVTELSSIVNVKNENITLTSIGGNEYQATLSELTSSYPNRSLIGSPSFSAVRSDVSGSSPTNAFNIDGQISPSESFSLDGQWKVSESGGDIVITLFSLSAPGSHTVSYRYDDSDSGVDTDGLYSVDYKNGAIYFSNPIPASGSVEYEVSLYSVFYNMARPVSDLNIEEINTENNTITFSSAFGMKFLKQDLAEDSRPQYMKILYDYYKKSTESLADLEPYFSPICKDIAFRAVTSNLLEEL